MSDEQKLKDCIAEYAKANKNLDDKVKIAEESYRQARQAETAGSNRQN